MTNKAQPITISIDSLKASYLVKQSAIKARLAEFQAIYHKATDAKLFEELVFCIFTAGASAKMGLNCIQKVSSVLINGSETDILNSITGAHRYARERSRYIIHTRNYLKEHCNLEIRAKLLSLKDKEERRDFFAANPGIKGIGYKEASHFLRNIGYIGYAILDKHILRSLHELSIIDDPKPPTTKKKYIALEEKLRNFAEEIEINFDELDLLLWSNKTGEILK
ncbi:MAG: N-glycosylase/DNA lyase [Acidobacteria bacterium]|nr:N-glycosylase/DNA lyase [Acidobacteriota bacterium]